MDQIRKGSQLNHVDPTEVASSREASNNAGGGDMRDQLLNQIRSGVNLRKVDPNEKKSEPKADANNAGGTGLAGALARALQERSRALNQTDDSSDSDNSSDDEWED